jgi:hypothetical protein
MPTTEFNLPRADLNFTQQQLREFVAFTTFRELVRELHNETSVDCIVKHQAATRAILGGQHPQIQEENAAESDDESVRTF